MPSVLSAGPFCESRRLSANNWSLTAKHGVGYTPQEAIVFPHLLKGGVRLSHFI